MTSSTPRAEWGTNVPQLSLLYLCYQTRLEINSNGYPYFSAVRNSKSALCDQIGGTKSKIMAKNLYKLIPWNAGKRNSNVDIHILMFSIPVDTLNCYTIPLSSR